MHGISPQPLHVIHMQGGPGPRGSKGPRGPTGNTGLSGDQGDAGPDGAPGRPVRCCHSSPGRVHRLCAFIYFSRVEFNEHVQR